MEKFVIALDQGTTSSRTIIFDEKANIRSKAQYTFSQIYPKPGWVEHDAEEIWKTQLKSLDDAVCALASGDITACGSAADCDTAACGSAASDNACGSATDCDISKIIDKIAGIGITNQRETTVVWNKHTGKPIYNAIVWQCRRTADECEELRKTGIEPYIKETTGLLIDAYFSGTKIKWILDNVEGAREQAESGDLLFGTIDTWLIWNLTGGSVHVTDYSNASRTMLFDIHNLEWDEHLCGILGIPMSMLPKAVPNSMIYGKTNLKLPSGIDLSGIPVCGAAGDQQAALFGQACFKPGDVKNTYGTGCFTLMNTGNVPVMSENGLVTSVAWSLSPDKPPVYALEGSIFNGGSTIQWIRDELKIISSSHECDILAAQVPDTGGVYIVPAFTGLGAPYWDMYARGTITGLTRGTDRRHISRAVLECITYQVSDLITAMVEDSGRTLTVLRVDGGASVSDIMMQFQSDILNIAVDRPECVETTALGAAFLAGLAVGVWKDTDEIASLRKCDMLFTADCDADRRQALLDGWHNAVRRTLSDYK